MQICLWRRWNTSLRKWIDSSTDYVDDKKVALRMHLIRLSTIGMTIFSKKKKGSDKGTRENQSRFD